MRARLPLMAINVTVIAGRTIEARMCEQENIMSRLDVWRFALAVAITFAALSGICAIGFVLSPESTIALFNGWTHGLDLKMLVPPGGKTVTFGGVVLGIISAAAVSFVAGAVLAASYNAFARDRKT